ncbi:DUF4265 domain-containing protein [Dasania sp. GY-MA-18]|uniref:DUF4265 domain-containing protein n=1 Tax=Dasania phycosphaerae TaxID=2950436 RepID=A0A9J6RJC3_9GAMM|nr:MULTISPECIES: DUF4265 domain-containing protein [Dasania]MCR8922037.1 DUF4265 domain-containing protein [Dasania sp. GY-MA-18]MCZ0864465.1 DUF4265 domain-containing protein [Dasania phycosphaerae]MCZ0868193.1 DUF4265 domain-containing protein [Dasania phycosphaerae]
MAVETIIGGQPTLELLAGQHPNGEMVVERVLVTPQPEEHSYLLLKSPVFVRGIARGDVIHANANDSSQPKGSFKVLQHGGNLCVRVFSKEDNDNLEQALTSAIEKLGGDLDIHEKRVLVYSIHVSCGFNTIEKLLNEQLEQHPQSNWLYGNVYHPQSGEPLNWWQAILSPD